MKDFKKNKERIRIVERIVDNWSNQGLKFAVAHGIEKYPHELGRDLDVFFERKYLEKAFQAACAILVNNNWKVVKTRTPYQLTQLYAFKDNIHLQIDFFKKLNWWIIPLVDNISISCQVGPFSIDNWAYFVKVILIQLLAGNLPRDFNQELLNDEDVHQKCQNMFGKVLTDKLFEVLKENKREKILEIQPQLLRRLIIFHVFLRPWRLFNTFSWVWINTKRYFTSVAPIIALVGPDGVGKSQTLKEIQKHSIFSTLWGDVVKHWRPSLIPDIGVLLGKRRVRQSVEYNLPRKKPGKGALFRLIYYAFDFILGGFLLDKPLSNKPKYILYDRCALDMAVDPVRYGLSTPKGSKLLWKIIPKPDRIILLYDTPDRIFKRKKELSKEEITRQLDIWRELFTEGKVSSIIQVDSSSERIARRIDEIIVEAFISKNGGTWINKRNEQDTLDWISSILSINSSQPCLTLKQNANGIDNNKNFYGYLTFTDGRGYLLSLDSVSSAINGLSLYNAQNLKGRFFKNILQLGFKMHLGGILFFKHFTHLQSVVFLKNEPNHLFLEHLKSVVGNNNISFSISLGTPSHHRKPVIQISDKKGQILFYVKVGGNEITNALVKNEARILKFLQTKELSFEVPQISDFGEWQGRVYCMQATSQRQTQKAPQTLSFEYLKAAKCCADLHSQLFRLQDSEYWKDITRRIDRISGEYYYHLLLLGKEKVEKNFENYLLPFHFCHGDFASWNALQLKDRIYIFDWEYARFEASPGYDLFHFVFQSLKLIKKCSPNEAFRSFRQNKTDLKLIYKYLEYLKLDLNYLEPLLIIYLLDRLTFECLKESTDYNERFFYSTLLSLCLFTEAKICL